MDAFIGTIVPLPYNFAPRGWALCNGQLLQIAQNTALFSLLGTTYGGDGRTTFALPNLNGRAVAGQGSGPGLTNRTMGEDIGSDTVSLISSELPSHTHAMTISSSAGQTAVPSVNTVLADPLINGFATSANATLAPGALALSGGSQPHNNQQPFLALTFCISLQGIFPPRP